MADYSDGRTSRRVSQISLSAIKQMAMLRPQRAYHVFPRILVDHVDLIEFPLKLLEEAKVVVTPVPLSGRAESTT